MVTIFKTNQSQAMYLNDDLLAISRHGFPVIDVIKALHKAGDLRYREIFLVSYRGQEWLNDFGGWPGDIRQIPDYVQNQPSVAF